MQTNQLLALAAAGVLSALALTGCSGADDSPQGDHGGPAPQSNVFEFQSPSYIADPGELTIRVPQALIEVAGDDASGLLVTSLTATPRELSSAKYCAVDLALDYADGGLDKASRPAETQAEHDQRVQDAVAGALQDRFGVTTVEEAQKAALDEYTDGHPEFLTSDELANAEKLAQQNVDDAVSSVDIGPYTAAKVWGILDSEPVSGLDPADPERGSYISTDSKTVTLVTKCATSPTDDDSSATATFTFPTLTSKGASTNSFAKVDLTVMKDGTISVTDSKVSGYVRDSSGTWIGK